MCGICGIYRRTDNSAIEPDDVRRMNAVLEHRGPDDEGYFFSDEIGLGMRRLSIIDLMTGQQPIWNEDRTCCIIYNGELYNFLDLRPQLEAKGHVFTTRSDTEVILHAYEEWGPACVRRFNGMFAIAIWDQSAHTLFLARDRVGEKPLYYYQDRDRLVFASEIKAILADRTIPRQLNVPGLANYLAFGRAAAPQTIYQDICKLLPAHYLLARDGQLQIQQFWDVGDEPQLATDAALSEDDYAASILSLLSDSVQRRMIADVPVGAFLSGGVDSSAIVALMKQHASGPVKTFSLGFAVGGSYNELWDARRVAKYFGTEHYELNVEHVDLVQTLRTLVYHYDEPFGDAASFPVYLLSRFARQHVKVVLTGDGGDELFGGYRRYAVDEFAGAYQKLPGVLTHTLIPAVVYPMRRLRRIKRTIQTLPITDPARRYAAWLEVFSPDMQAELLCPEVAATLAEYDPAWQYPLYYSRLNCGTATDHLNRLMYTDLKTLLVDAYMEKTDKATMAASLEARLPLLDYRLVELAFQIPSSSKLKGWSTKRILKRAVAPLVPSEVLRKRKHGFAVPTDPWFRGDLKDFAYEVLFDQRTRQRGYFNSQFVEKLWHEHVAGREVWDTQLWLLLNFELWHRIYIDGEPV
jgi:asparagine synthase (glutamine-hydrolysing)